MTTTAIRERLYDYIREADEHQIKNIYMLFEDQMSPPILDWSEDEDCMAELNDRVKRWKDGTDPSFSLEQIKAELEQIENDDLKKSDK
jgi:hypothetical protein